jgi:hypothetical protein
MSTASTPADDKTAIDKLLDQLDKVPYLAGNKTYIVGAGLLVVAFFRYKTGDIEGATNAFMMGLGFIFGRHALTK